MPVIASVSCVPGFSGTQEFAVVAFRADTLHVRTASGAAVEPIALDGVQSLEVYRGRSRSSTFGRRVLIGAGVGALAGGLLVAVTDNDDFFADSKGGQFAIGAVGGAVVGGTIGALAGLSGRAGHWETVLSR
jgi:hypothetical protein